MPFRCSFAGDTEISRRTDKQRAVNVEKNAIYRFRQATATPFNMILEAIKRHIVDGERVEITGFGSFEVTQKKGRQGRNPLTGERIAIPEKKTLNFKPSKLLKKDLNK